MCYHLCVLWFWNLFTYKLTCTEHLLKDRQQTDHLSGENWWLEEKWKKEHWLFTAYPFELLDSWVTTMYYLSKLIIFIFNSFIKVDLTFNKLCIFKVYDLMFQQVDTAWNHPPQSRAHQHIQHPQSFLVPLCDPALLSLYTSSLKPPSIISLLSWF